MNADEESDEGTVPMKRPNKEGFASAEDVEGRTSPKGNGGESAAVRTPSRDTALIGLVAVRQAARRSKSVRFTALLHHITADLLKQSYLALVRDAAPGTDGVTWQAYGENLDDKLKNLVAEHAGAVVGIEPNQRACDTQRATLFCSCNEDIAAMQRIGLCWPRPL